MPSEISYTKRQSIKAPLELDVAHTEVTKRVKVCERTVQRISHYFKNYGTSKRSNIIPKGCPSTITTEMEEVACIFLEYC